MRQRWQNIRATNCYSFKEDCWKEATSKYVQKVLCTPYPVPVPSPPAASCSVVLFNHYCHSPPDPPPTDYPDYGTSYYNNFPMKEEDERLAKNGTKYEEEEEEPNNEIDY